jgi:hypothetical protein
MSYDERLIGSKPSEEFIEKSRARRDAMFKRRFEQREAIREEQRSLNESSLALLRKSATGDLAIEAAVKAAKAARERSLAHAKRSLHPPQRAKVLARFHVGSVDVTFVPPYWPSQSTATTGLNATATVSVDENAGTMGFWLGTGNDGKTATADIGLGYYFQPLADNGIMDVYATPSFDYFWSGASTLDSWYNAAVIGLQIDQYTEGDEYVATPVNQSITLWNSTGGEDRGSNSGYPLSASTPVDSDHYYVIWVQAAGEAGADGWSAAWGSESNSFLNLTVPSISVHAY